MLTSAKMLLASLVLLFAGADLAHWTKVPVPTTASLRGLSVVNANVVWASGTGGTVIKTTDGGKSWSVIVVPGAETLDFRGIRAWNDKTALIISSGPAEKGQARIFRTQDGGKSWQQVFEEKRAGVFFDAIAFWDNRHGIVLSDPIDGHFALFHTDDGGTTWTQIPPAALPPALPNEGAFAASNSCLTMQGKSNVWFATGGGKVARVFRSSDRGQTWNVAETPMHPANASSGIFSLAFLDMNHGVAVGGDYAHPEKSDLPNVMFSSDGGRSWQVGAGTTPAGMYLSSVARVARPSSSHANFIAAGTKGLVSSLVGTEPGVTEPGMDAENLNSVAVTGLSRHDAWVVGAKGVVYRGPLVRHSFAPYADHRNDFN